MIRTQIRLPDDIYERARKVCAAREISLAELSRRGLEYILSVYAPASADAGNWQPPKPRALGWKGLDDSAIKEQARSISQEIKLKPERRKQAP